MDVNEEVLSFIAEWFDPHPALVKQYALKYYTESSEVEMKDLSTNRKFLKRTKVDLSPQDFIVGDHILLFSRNLKLVNYADIKTRKLLDTSNEETVAIMPFHKFQVAALFIGSVEDLGFTVVNMRSIAFGKEKDNLENIPLSINIPSNMLHEAGEKILAISFRGTNSIKVINDFVTSRHDMYGEDIVCTKNVEEAVKLTDFVYCERSPTATYSNCTCCIIKPHIVKSRKVGAIMNDIISEHYEVSAIKLCNLDRTAATEFFKVYNGVWKEFNLIVDSLRSGPSIAMEVRSNVDNPVKCFRKTAGPWNVDMARGLYPHSIRAKFGENSIENAIHCTDLEEDAIAEVQYFFEVL